MIRKINRTESSNFEVIFLLSANHFTYLFCILYAKSFFTTFWQYLS